jgi:dihydrofolate synthase/folylpolyglutamate synthase
MEPESAKDASPSVFTPDGAADDPASEFLRSRIDYERMLAVSYDQRDFRLDRMRQLLARLGNPQDALRIVHVAGTKGKGSTAAMIAAVLQAAGLRTGLYSSPHLDRVEERIAIDGASCPRGELARLVARTRPAVEAMDELPTPDDWGSNRPTYFEIVTALALLRFAECGLDAAVLEVGLGGRLDSTNVCAPLVSVITSISYDHTQQLGNTLAAIAGEKAGIIKPGVPVVSGVLDDEPRAVIAAIAQQHGCRLIQRGRDFDFCYHPPRQLELRDAHGSLDYFGRGADAARTLDGVELGLLGTHQAANAAVAIAVLEELVRCGWNIPERAFREGLANVRWPGRVEVIARHPTVVLDTAHNGASIEALVQTLSESFSPGPRVLVFATTRDKDARGMLSALLPAFDEIILTRYWQNPRGMPAESLAAMAAELSTKPVRVCADAATAWSLARELAGRDHLVCITGSFFIAAEIRAAMRGTAG